MLRWLNPMWWYMGAQGAFEFARSNPLGFGFVWFASGVQTLWTTAFPASILYPNWARDMVETAWPAVKQFAVAAWSVAEEIVMTVSNTS